MKLRLYNLDRQHSHVFGGEPSVHDFCHVYDESRTEPNAMTGKSQPVLVFSGTLTECHEFMRRARQ